ncbi:unnamed protein product [Closterium sp. NIES-54]
MAGERKALEAAAVDGLGSQGASAAATGGAEREAGMTAAPAFAAGTTCTCTCKSQCEPLACPDSNCPTISHSTHVPPPPHLPLPPLLSTTTTSALLSVLQAGVKNVLLTRGKHGACLASLQSHSVPATPESHASLCLHYFPALPVRVPEWQLNLSGAGDCLLGATVAATVLMAHGQRTAPAAAAAATPPCQAQVNFQVELQERLVAAVAVGMAAARVAVESRENVPWGELQRDVLPLLPTHD